MGYLTGIFERAKLGQICSFLNCGDEATDIDSRPYWQRLSEKIDEALEMIETYFPDDEKTMKTLLTQTVEAYQDVYMEIGLQIGFLLSMQVHQACGRDKS